MFLYRLAFYLGKTKSELLADLGGARELGEWMAFFELEPPEIKEDERAAALMATIYNASGNLKRGRVMKPKDFMPKRRVKQSADEQIHQFKKLTRIS